jgi:hypothetical protein
VDGRRIGVLERGQTISAEISDPQSKDHSVSVVGVEATGQVWFKPKPGHRVSVMVVVEHTAGAFDPSHLMTAGIRNGTYNVRTDAAPVSFEVLDLGRDGRRVQFSVGHYGVSLQDSLGIGWDLTEYTTLSSDSTTILLDLWKAFQTDSKLRDRVLRNPCRVTVHVEPGSHLIFEQSLSVRVLKER